MWYFGEQVLDVRLESIEIGYLVFGKAGANKSLSFVRTMSPTINSKTHPRMLPQHTITGKDSLTEQRTHGI